MGIAAFRTLQRILDAGFRTHPDQGAYFRSTSTKGKPCFRHATIPPWRFQTFVYPRRTSISAAIVLIRSLMQ